MGRDGGRGGGGGGVGLTDDGVAGRTGEEDPEEKRLGTILDESHEIGRVYFQPHSFLTTAGATSSWDWG